MGEGTANVKYFKEEINPWLKKNEEIKNLEEAGRVEKTMLS